MPDLRPLPMRLVHALLDALLPSCCALCGGHARAAVCADCEQAYVTPTPRCPCCANPTGALDSTRHCGACLAQAPPFDATWAACDYASPLDSLVLQLKFGAQLALAPWMARVLHGVIASEARALPDVLCPVPLGPARLIERGYNQALEVARWPARWACLSSRNCCTGCARQRRNRAPRPATGAGTCAARLAWPARSTYMAGMWASSTMSCRAATRWQKLPPY
jgi:predicted amidophosphoribosyltransferase